MSLIKNFSACYGGEERLSNVTYLFVKYLVVKMDLVNVISNAVAVYNDVSMMSHVLVTNNVGSGLDGVYLLLIHTTSNYT
jgi:hypothetical protein